MSEAGRSYALEEGLNARIVFEFTGTPTADGSLDGDCLYITDTDLEQSARGAYVDGRISDFAIPPRAN